jgi:hypothetical protein
MRASCNFCGIVKRVLAAPSGATVCVDCAATALHFFSLEGVVPQKVTHLDRTVSKDELEEFLRREGFDPNDSNNR